MIRDCAAVPFEALLADAFNVPIVEVTTLAGSENRTGSAFGLISGEGADCFC